MTHENEQSQQPQTGSTTEPSLEEQRNTAFLRSAWRDFFAEQGRKSEAAPTEK
jgi:hypothetical protein